MNVAALALQNLLALSSPHLVRLGMRQDGEVDSAGSAYVAILATTVAFFAIVAVAPIVVGASLALVGVVGTMAATAIAYMSATAILWLQAAGAVHVLTKRFEKYCLLRSGTEAWLS
ncbi:MAG: hypothetical protein ABJE47_15825 [bacterium]